MNTFFRPQFLEDMAREELWLMQHASSGIADQWHESLIETLQFIPDHPSFGRERKDLKISGIRSWGVQNFRRWIVFYGVRDNDLILFRVVSGTMNLFALQFERIVKNEMNI